MTSTPPPLSSTSAPTSSSPPATSTTSPKRRKVKYAKAYGYLLDPSLIYQQAIKDGTAIEGQLGCTFAQYKIRLAKHCGIKYDNIISMRNPGRDKPSMYCECDNIVLVRNPVRDMAPIFCLVTATNLSKQSRIPPTDIIEKAKEFLGTTEEPQWYFMLRE